MVALTVHWVRVLLVALAFSFAPPTESEFNSYDVFLSSTVVRGGCSSRSPESFRNRTYTLRTNHVYPFLTPVVLQDGRFVENFFGRPEWETSLALAQPIQIARRAVVLLMLKSVHVAGTGSAGHVLVVDCHDETMTVLFEASGEGVTDASETDGELKVTRFFWSARDAHCCPSRIVDERYRWSGGRFAHVGQLDRRRPR